MKKLFLLTLTAALILSGCSPTPSADDSSELESLRTQLKILQEITTLRNKDNLIKSDYTVRSHAYYISLQITCVLHQFNEASVSRVLDFFDVLGL